MTDKTRRRLAQIEAAVQSSRSQVPQFVLEFIEADWSMKEVRYPDGTRKAFRLSGRRGDSTPVEEIPLLDDATCGSP